MKNIQILLKGTLLLRYIHIPVQSLTKVKMNFSMEKECLSVEQKINRKKVFLCFSFYAHKTDLCNVWIVTQSGYEIQTVLEGNISNTLLPIYTINQSHIIFVYSRSFICTRVYYAIRTQNVILYWIYTLYLYMPHKTPLNITCQN